MLMPKKVKFRKQQKGKRRGKCGVALLCRSVNTG